MRPTTKMALISNVQRLSGRLPANWDRGLRALGKVALNYRGERKTAGRYVQYRIARRLSPIVQAPFGDARLLVDLRDQGVGRTVFLTGGFERWHMEAAVELLHTAGWETSGREFLDVGANIGTSTIDALVRFGFERALCFEPHPDNVRLLRLNILLNGLEGRAAVHPVALSDRDGAALLQCSTDNFGDNRVRQLTGASPGATRVDEVWVESRRLDAFVDEGEIDPARVGLLWIDAQGQEPQIIDGARRLLEARVPTVVEYCPWVLHDGVVALEGQIRDHFTTVLDLRAAAAGDKQGTVLRHADLPRLRRRYASRGYTDLLLLP